MKKLLLFLIFLIGSQLMAQTNKKFIFLMHFTSCREQTNRVKNDELYKGIDSFPNDVIHLGIHANYPDTKEEFYLDYPQQIRFKNLFNIQSTVSTFINGYRMYSLNTPSLKLFNTGDTIVKNKFNKTSEIGLKVVETGTTTRNVKVDIKSFSGYKAGADLRLFVAIVQTQVDTNTFNGEKLQRNVIRTLLPDTNGTKITLPAIGATITNNYSYNITKSYWDQNRLKAIAWVMDMNQINIGTTLNFNVLNAGTQALTSADENTILADNLVELAPNPVMDQLNIQLYNNIEANNYEIYNLSGQQILKNNIGKSVDNFDIDVTSLNQGMYILRVNTNDGIIIKKFVKN